jgi:hypothetical protein
VVYSLAEDHRSKLTVDCVVEQVGNIDAES